MRRHVLAPPHSVSSTPTDDSPKPAAKGVLAGFVELRSRGVKAILALLAAFLCLMPFTQQVFDWVAEPVIAHMPDTGSLIARQVASPFLTPLKATFWVALFIAMPFMLYQLWRFVDHWVPASRRVALPFVIASTLLFYGGVAFAFFLVLPMAFAFFQSVTPTGVVVATDINAYLDFVIGMSLAFGLAFQVPIAIIILVWTGLVSRKTLARGRAYVFLGAFVIGMLLTPPDIFSQTLLAVPMYCLFEAALFFCARFLPNRP
jgi:sec-independent protein translocase protein TatC